MIVFATIFETLAVMNSEGVTSALFIFCFGGYSRILEPAQAMVY